MKVASISAHQIAAKVKVSQSSVRWIATNDLGLTVFRRVPAQVATAAAQNKTGVNHSLASPPKCPRNRTHLLCRGDKHLPEPTRITVFGRKDEKPVLV